MSTETEPPGRRNDDDVYFPGVGWVSAQLTRELPWMMFALAWGPR